MRQLAGLAVSLIAAVTFACHVEGPPDPAAANAPREQACDECTDCHDGTWCPPAYPECPLPLSRRACTAQGANFIVPSQAPAPTRDAGPWRDAYDAGVVR